jgi:hypothetical protein
LITALVLTGAGGAFAAAAAVVIIPASSPGTPLLTDENGSATLVRVNLSTVPTGVVGIHLDNPRPSEVRLSTTDLVFTPGNSDLPQAVVITGVADHVVDGNQVVTIAVTVNAPGTDYVAVTASPIVVENQDVDVTGVQVSGDTAVTEAGPPALVSVKLKAKPSSPVTVTIGNSSELTVSPNPLTFTPANWDWAQEVSISAPDNHVADGTRLVLEQATANGGGYGGQTATFSVTIYDTPPVLVDMPPTIDQPDDLTILEDAGPQTVQLTGISPGQPGETQVVTVTVATTVTSGTLAFTVPSGSPTVAYTNPSSLASLQFTPVPLAYGTADITVSANDGVTTTSQLFTLTVQAINYRPTLVRQTALTVGYRGNDAFQGLNADPLAPGQLVASDVETPAAQLRWLLALAPSIGHLSLNGTRMEIGDEVLQGQIDARQLTYTHDGTLAASDGFVMRIIDGGVATIPPAISDLVVVPVTIDSSGPIIDHYMDGDVTWTEATPPVTLATAALVQSLSANFDTGNLTLAITAGGHAGDTLSIRNDGTASGQIGVVGNQVILDGNTIGIWSGGDWPAAPLVVDFTAYATPAATQALVRALQFVNTTQNPGVTRTVTLTITDDLGQTSAPQDLPVHVVPVDNPPILPDLTLDTVTNLEVDGQLLATDPDSPVLTYAVTTPPALGVLTDFNPATGSFIYWPFADAAGSDQFSVTVADATTTVPATVHVNITGPGAAHRLWIVSKPSMEAQVGDPLTWVVQVDVSELLATPDLQFTLIGAPAYMDKTDDLPTNSTTINWPTVAGTDHLRFMVKVVDTISGSVDVQPLVLYIHPLPVGGL